MIKEGKLGIQEVISLSVITISTKVFYTSPAVLSGLVGNTGWLTTLVSAITALIAFLFIYILLKRFPGKDIIEIFRITLGKIGGFVFSIILAVFMLYTAATRVAEFTEIIKVYIFPLSPNWYIVGIYIACVFTMSMLGLESIARFSKLLIYFMLIGFVVILILNIQNYDMNNLFPFFGYGLDKIALQGVIRSSAYGEIIILAIFAQSFQGAKNIKKEGIAALSLSGLIISISLFTFNLSFPYYIAKNITAPMYEMATLIDHGRFLQRVEPLFLFIWTIGSFISASIVFYSFVWIFCKLFRIQDKKPIVLGGVIILFAMSLMHRDMISIIFINVQSLRDYGAFVFFLLPLLALFVALLRKKGRKSNA